MSGNEISVTEKPEATNSDARNDVSADNINRENASVNPISIIAQSEDESRGTRTNFIYDKRTNRVFGRTMFGWVQILGYYLIFLGILLSFFFGFMSAALAIIRLRERPFYNIQTLKAANPAVAITITPIKTSSEMHRSAMYKTETYAKSLTDVLQHYTFENVQDCKNKVTFDREEYPCHFNTSSLGPCSYYPYGYDNHQPCLLLKINKVLDWIPIPYNKTSILPKLMPDDLKSNIKSSDITKIWVSCEGRDSSDKENIKTIKYYPEQSFETYYFPFTAHINYQSPLIAVQISSDKRNVTINLTCFLWVQDFYIIDTVYQISF